MCIEKLTKFKHTKYYQKKLSKLKYLMYKNFLNTLTPFNLFILNCKLTFKRYLYNFFFNFFKINYKIKKDWCKRE